jgi:membrane-associated protease RseP (regulator of RpoE activity)
MKRLSALLLFVAAGLAQADNTTIKVDAHYDAASKTTLVQTRVLNTGVGKTFIDPSAVSLYLGGTVAGDGKEDLYLDVVYTSNGWKHIETAMDADAVSLPVTPVERRVAGGGKIMEHVRINLARSYLETHAETGLALRIQGKEGDASFKLPPAFVHDFLATLAENHPGQSTAAAAREKPRFGAQLAPLQPAFASILKAPAPGLLVASVLPEGMAGKAGLQQGDVLTRVNNTAVTSEQQLQQALDAASGTISLFVWRNGATVSLQASW